MMAGGMRIPQGDEWFRSALDASGGTFDYASLLRAIEYCPDFRTAVDGGAHVGTWSKPLSRWFRKVVAFEPQPENLECLSANVQGIEIHDKALSDVPGKFSMSPGPDNSGQWHLAEGDGVEAVALDSLNLQDVDFLKLDVEGWELKALQGAIETLKRCMPVVLIEENGLCSRYGIQPGASANFLRRLGYECVAKVNKDYIFSWS